MRIALTGGIATGKSYCLQKFAQLGVPTVDADAIAREVVAPGSVGLAAVQQRFGSSVVQPDGELDRQAVARLVFRDPAARRDLEAIVHPIVYERIQAWFSSQPPKRIGMADIPLLFETGHQRDFDCVIVAACSPMLQIERLTARGLSASEAQQRLAAQLPIDKKARAADYVIDTSGTTADTDRQVIEVWERLRAAAC